MKRVGLGLLGAFVVAGLTAFFGLGIGNGQFTIAPNVAQAGCAKGDCATEAPVASTGKDGGLNLNKADDTICVAVPIFAGKGRGKCPEGQAEIPNDAASGGAIIYYLKLILKLLNGLVGGVIILMLIIAGIQYILSAADPSQVKAAKDRIQNAIIALVLYLMMFAILNFLVPGGILS